MRICIVMPGRYGDIINVLPIAKYMADLGNDVSVCVCKEFADLLDGVSYAKPVVFNGHYMDGDAAVAWLRETGRYDTVHNARVPGQRPDAPYTDSFTKEAWHRCGVSDLWHELPLVFDRRSPEREAAIRANMPKNKPLVVMALSGHSSPLKAAAYVAAAVKSKVGGSGKARVVDISRVRATRIYDLLGILDMASLLIATDSAPLHLSYASKTPTYALVADSPTSWHGTASRKHWVGSCVYKDVKQNLASICAAARDLCGVRR